MIGDGHYLNTISEPGPTPQTIAVWLETTLMRKMMGQSVTLSLFINSEKMFSTQFLNAFPLDFYTMCLSVHLSIQPSYPSLLAPHTLVLFDTHVIPGALQCLYLFHSSHGWAFLITCPCLLSDLVKWVFVWVMCVLANLLLFRRLTSAEQWRDWQDLKMLCTVLSCPMPAGWKEWRLLPGSLWRATWEGLSGGISHPERRAHHFTCKWSQNILLCLWTWLYKTLNNPEL